MRLRAAHSRIGADDGAWGEATSHWRGCIGVGKGSLGQVTGHWGRLITCPNAARWKAEAARGPFSRLYRVASGLPGPGAARHGLFSQRYRHDGAHFHSDTSTFTAIQHFASIITLAKRGIPLKTPLRLQNNPHTRPLGALAAYNAGQGACKTAPTPARAPPAHRACPGPAGRSRICPPGFRAYVLAHHPETHLRDQHPGLAKNRRRPSPQQGTPAPLTTVCPGGPRSPARNKAPPPPLRRGARGGARPVLPGPSPRPGRPRAGNGLPGHHGRRLHPD